MIKYLIIVSTGRCGTTKLAETLRSSLPSEKFDVHHQLPESRLFNIVGNILFHLNIGELFKELMYNHILKKYAKSEFFVITDPLTAMILPLKIINSKEVAIIQVERNSNDFAKSFFNFSRKKRNSFIAHNFFPFWQPFLWPLENYLNKNILKKYAFISVEKNKFFEQNYKVNPNYKYYSFSEILDNDCIKNIFSENFNFDIDIAENTMKIKVNES